MNMFQFVTLTVGLAMAAGFAFGGMAHYAGIVDAPSAGGGDGGEFDRELPDQNYVEGSFGHSFQELRALAAIHDVVFISVIYEENPPEHDYSELPGQLSNRVFVELVDSSETSLDAQTQENEYPHAMVIGGTRDGATVHTDVTPGNLGAAACDAFGSWQTEQGSVVSFCQQ